MDCSPPSSSVRGILQARILKWVPISFSRGSSQPRDQTQVSCTAADSLPTDLPFKPSIALGPYTTLHPLIIPSLSPTYSVLAMLASLLSPIHTCGFWTTLPPRCSWASLPHLLWQFLEVPLLIKAVPGHIFALPCLPFLFHSTLPHPAHGPWSPLAGFGERLLVVHLPQAGKLHETCILFIHHCIPITFSRVWPRVWALYIFVRW